jgi:hypothetical protein
VLGKGFMLDGVTEGAFKVGAGDVIIKDGPDGSLTIENKLNPDLLVSYVLRRAGNVSIEEARTEGWVLPVNEKAARELKEQLRAKKSTNAQMAK